MSTLASTREAIYETIRGEVPHTHVDDDGDLHFRSGPTHVWVIVRAVAVSSRRVSRDAHDRFGGDTWHPFPEGE